MTTEPPVPDHRPAEPFRAGDAERAPVTHTADRGARAVAPFPRPILVFGDD